MPARNETNQAIRIRCAVDHPFPCDLIVRTPEKLRRRIELGNWFLREIAPHGKVLYAKTDSRVVTQGRKRPAPRRSSPGISHGRATRSVFTVSGGGEVLRIRNLLTSPFAWNGTIVPSGEFIIEHDPPDFLVVFGGLFASRVVAREDVHGRGQAGFCARPTHRFAHNLYRCQQQALASSSHVRKETMFDRIVLRAVRRIMSHANLAVDAVRQLLQLILEDVPSGCVTAATVAQ